jgi:hypothetical protein
MNVYIAPPYVWVMFFVIVIYMTSILYLCSYLKRVHPDTWLKLGSPSFLNNSVLNGCRTTRFIFVSEYRSLSDPRLTRMIWSIRSLFALIIALYIFSLIFGLPGSR